MLRTIVDIHELFTWFFRGETFCSVKLSFDRVSLGSFGPIVGFDWDYSGFIWDS